MKPRNKLQPWNIRFNEKRLDTRIDLDSPQACGMFVERVTRTAKIRDSSRHAHLHRPSIGSGGCGVKLFRLSNGWLYERVKYIATLAICCKSGWLQFFSLWLDLMPPFATSVTKCHQTSTDDLNTTIKLDGFDGISIRFAGQQTECLFGLLGDRSSKFWLAFGKTLELSENWIKISSIGRLDDVDKRHYVTSFPDSILVPSLWMVDSATVERSI